MTAKSWCAVVHWCPVAADWSRLAAPRGTGGYARAAPQQSAGRAEIALCQSARMSLLPAGPFYTRSDTSNCSCPSRNVATDDLLDHHSVRLAYQLPVSSTFISKQISYQPPINSVFLSEEISTNNRSNEQTPLALSFESSKLASMPRWLDKATSVLTYRMLGLDIIFKNLNKNLLCFIILIFLNSHILLYI